MEKVLLYQAYGHIDIINECRFSLLKYLQVYQLRAPADITIVVYTDQPQSFHFLVDVLPKLVLVPVSPVQIKAWRGTIDFVHRVKIEIIKDFLQKNDAQLIYCDTDTYLVKPIESLFHYIGDNKLLMHDFEGTINATVYPNFRKWENFLQKNTVRYGSDQVTFSQDLKMWNAGVLGLSTNHLPLLNDVLSLTDHTYSQFRKHIAEQFAFSYIFQKNGQVAMASDHICHYWDLKEFRTFLQAFFTHTKHRDVQELVKQVTDIHPMQILEDKLLFKQLPVYQQILKKLAGKGWKIRNYMETQ